MAGPAGGTRYGRCVSSVGTINQRYLRRSLLGKLKFEEVENSA